MGLFDDAVPGGNISKPIMIALGALLVGKMLGGFSRSDDDQAPAQPEPADTGNDGGLLGGLGGLLEKLGSAGHEKTVDSWVRPGENQSISPGHLENALGSQTISDLARRAGVSESELLEQLSRVLPGVVDKLTPQGQVPDNRRLASMFEEALRP